MAIAFENTTAPEQASTANSDAEASGNQAKRHFGATDAGAAPDQAGGRNSVTLPRQVGPGPKSTTAAAADPRFHIFVIDSGWNCAASKVLADHIDILTHLNIDDELYVLDRKTSIALLRHYPLQVGRDPTIAVHDLKPRHRHRIKHTHGFRMHLGILDDEHQVLGALKMFARFLVTHRDADDIDRLVREDLHRQGIAGAIQIIGGHEHHKLIEA
jgi:hypothetical protein